MPCEEIKSGNEGRGDSQERAGDFAELDWNKRPYVSDEILSLTL
jgi:hypothetical protein